MNYWLDLWHYNRNNTNIIIIIVDVVAWHFVNVLNMHSILSIITIFAIVIAPDTVIIILVCQPSLIVGFPSNIKNKPTIPSHSTIVHKYIIVVIIVSISISVYGFRRWSGIVVINCILINNIDQRAHR